MARGQLQELYFGSVPRCNARLRQLFDWQYVTRYYLPQARWGSEAVYLLGPQAVPLVAAKLEREEPEVRKQCRTRTPTFLEHTLAIVDFYLNLRRAVERQADAGLQPAVEMERWLPEMLCRHEYEIRATHGGGWKTEVFKPDAFVRLTEAGTNAYRPYFVEIDLGHTSSNQFVGKLLSHQRYLESGLFAQMYGGTAFQTLVVTTSENRRDNLRGLVEEQGSGLFWFTTFAAIEERGALQPIWHVPGGDACAALI